MPTRSGSICCSTGSNAGVSPEVQVPTSDA
jgi:hypothetical protein